MALSTSWLLSTKLQQRHWVLRYGLAVVVFWAVIGLALLNKNYDVKLNLTIPIVFALVATVWYAGRGPGILLSILFQATTVLYAPPPPDGSYAKEWFGFLSTLSLYLFLVLIISGLQRAGNMIGAQRDLLQVTLSSIGDGVVTTDNDGKINFMNGMAEAMTGWEASDARGRPLSEVIHVVEEKTRRQLPDPARRVFSNGAFGVENHSLLLSRDGREIPIDNSAAPIQDGELMRGVVLVFSDVSQRKLAERARQETEIMHRIIEAQEGERQRIARGLHDQLGQQMTALRLKVEAIAGAMTSESELEGELAELRNAAIDIDRDIGFLSWELKPTELEELGLTNALGSFVREWSRQYGVTAEFESRLVGPAGLGPEIETNLYRIVQEALNNILRHANATTVSVLLQERASDLALIIEDNGKGFNDGAAAGGVGLAGMRERAALLKGTLDVDSSPGEGTTVIVRIPKQVPSTSAA